MNIATWLMQATQVLTISPTARLDAEILLAHELNITREKLYVNFQRNLSPAQLTTLNEYVQRRQRGEPIAYLIGRCEFWSLNLCVTSDVLVPRPETELLVEKVLYFLSQDQDCCVADLGTGSGAIALAIAHERASWTVLATDCSEKALQVAKLNAQHLQLPNISYYVGDWCHALPNQKFDVIVSNPPYVSLNELHLINLEVTF